MNNDKILLKVDDLKTYFFAPEGVAKAVDGVSFEIKSGQTLGMVGESGCGKSVTALSIMRLIDKPGKIVGGSIDFKNRNLVKSSDDEIRAIRGDQISMIFQEPMTSLNPVFTIGDQIAEVYRVHRNMKKDEALRETLRMLELVGIPDAKSRLNEYPHQLSGGMRQRIMIAMALACNPDLLIADEPTTALDVTVQAQILALIEKMQQQFGSAVLIITHDLGVVAQNCENVAVMYAGMIVEYAAVKNLFKTPCHPYTLGLMASVPNIEEIKEGRTLVPIKGNVPDPKDYPPGCRFHPRCDFATQECSKEIPSLFEPFPGHFSRCIHIESVLKSQKKSI